MSETSFHLRQDHIELLQHTHVRWSDAEYGAPAIDSKRPFGNSTQIEQEICQYCGLDPIATGEYDQDIYDNDEKADALQTYHELDTALRIVLSNQTFTPGVFVRDDPYTSVWTRAVVEHGDECPACGAEVLLSTAGMESQWTCRECGAMQDV